MAVELALLVAGLLAIVLVGFLAVVTYNDVIGLQRRCERAWANIDVALKQRHDQLPALVSAVRGAMAFEQSVLEEVTRTRARYQPEASIHDQAVVSEETSQAVRSLFAVVERYPELRSHAERHGAAGGDRAPGDAHRPPPRALQRAGVPVRVEYPPTARCPPDVPCSAGRT